MSQKVSLKAYFERIGFSGSIAPTLATLETIHALHPAAIAFENLDSLLGLPVSLELGAIEKKLLADGRGGYCYEHNLLLQAVLRELDFSVKILMARVLWSDIEAVDRPATHMLLAVEISGARYIADVGFGGLTLTAPLRLRADIEQATPHETFRLTGGDPLWQLEARIDDAWKPLYAFDTTETSASDHAAANDAIAADAASPFRRDLLVALSPEGKRLALLNNRLTTHVQGQPSESRVLTSLAEMHAVLTDIFDIHLPAADLLDPKLEAILADAGVAEV